MNNLAKTNCNENLQERWEEVRELGESICLALSREVKKIGLPDAKAQLIAPWKRASFELQRDPASGHSSLVGTWKNAEGVKVGSIIFHCDGSFFAEYDVISQHPGDQRWFVEAVNAWGNKNTLKAEPRLLPMPS